MGKLEEYMKRNNISNKQLSEDLGGIDKTRLSRTVHGRVLPQLDLAVKIEQYTNGEVTPKDLYDNFMIQQKYYPNNGIRKNRKRVRKIIV